MSADWDPGHYLRYVDHRSRPGVELIARIPDGRSSRIVDLGCGTGNLTAILAQRFPHASVVGIDSSPQMIDVARTEHPGIEWQVEDIARWDPPGPVDVVFSNAALHWLDGHHVLFPRIRSWLADGGTIAVQMPDNWSEPTHRIPAEILDDGTWPEPAVEALLRDRLAAPADYRRWVQPAHVDLWSTSYHQVLTGDDAVWNWVTGSVLRPVLAALDDGDTARFVAECRARYRDAYPQASDGTTVLPFRRFFMVATAP